MNIWEFLDHPNPFPGCFLLAWLFVAGIYKCWNRFMRHLNIKSKGWPPPHCDADGDMVESDSKEE